MLAISPLQTGAGGQCGPQPGPPDLHPGPAHPGRGPPGARQPQGRLCPEQGEGQPGHLHGHHLRLPQLGLGAGLDLHLHHGQPEAQHHRALPDGDQLERGGPAGSLQRSEPGGQVSAGPGPGLHLGQDQPAGLAEWAGGTRQVRQAATSSISVFQPALQWSCPRSYGEGYASTLMPKKKKNSRRHPKPKGCVFMA